MDLEHYTCMNLSPMEKEYQDHRGCLLCTYAIPVDAFVRRENRVISYLYVCVSTCRGSYPQLCWKCIWSRDWSFGQWAFQRWKVVLDLNIRDAVVTDEWVDNGLERWRDEWGEKNRNYTKE